MARQSSKPSVNRIAEFRKAKGLTQAGLGDALGGVHWTTISDLERGKQGLTEEWMRRIASVLGSRPSDFLIEAAAPATMVFIDGVVGAGGEVNADISQIYDGDVAQIELDIPLPPDIRAYEVWGNSMLPKYDPGDVILVRGSAVPPDLILGNVALVVTRDNRRYLKRVLKGSEPGLFDLESFNAPTMKDQEINEAGSIYVVVPANEIRRPIADKEIARRFKGRGG